MFCPGNVGLCSVQLYMSHSAPTRSICILCTQTHTSISHICIYKQTVWSTEKFKGDPRLWDNLINMHCVHSHTHTHSGVHVCRCMNVFGRLRSGISALPRWRGLGSTCVCMRVLGARAAVKTKWKSNSPWSVLLAPLAAPIFLPSSLLWTRCSTQFKEKCLLVRACIRVYVC